MIIFMTTVAKKRGIIVHLAYKKTCLLQLAKLRTKSKIFSNINPKQPLLDTYDETPSTKDSELCKSTVHRRSFEVISETDSLQVANTMRLVLLNVSLKPR